MEKLAPQSCFPAQELREGPDPPLRPQLHDPDGAHQHQTAATADTSETIKGGTEGHSAKDARSRDCPRIQGLEDKPRRPHGEPVIPSAALNLFWRKAAARRPRPAPLLGAQ